MCYIGRITYQCWSYLDRLCYFLGVLSLRRAIDGVGICQQMGCMSPSRVRIGVLLICRSDGHAVQSLSWGRFL